MERGYRKTVKWSFDKVGGGSESLWALVPGAGTAVGAPSGVTP